MSGVTYRKNAYYERIVLVVRRLLLSKGYVSPVDIFAGLDLVDAANIVKWRAGNVDYFERIIRCNLSKASQIMRVLKFHALEVGLRPSSSIYFARGTKKNLRFSKSGNPSIEAAYATHYVGTPPKAKAKEQAVQNEGQ